MAEYKPGDERFVFFDPKSSCPSGLGRGPWDCPNLFNLLLLHKWVRWASGQTSMGPVGTGQSAMAVWRRPCLLSRGKCRFTLVCAAV